LVVGFMKNILSFDWAVGGIGIFTAKNGSYSFYNSDRVHKAIARLMAADEIVYFSYSHKDLVEVNKILDNPIDFDFAPMVVKTDVSRIAFPGYVGSTLDNAWSDIDEFMNGDLCINERKPPLIKGENPSYVRYVNDNFEDCYRAYKIWWLWNAGKLDGWKYGG